MNNPNKSEEHLVMHVPLWLLPYYENQCKLRTLTFFFLELQPYLYISYRGPIDTIDGNQSGERSSWTMKSIFNSSPCVGKLHCQIIKWLIWILFATIFNLYWLQWVCSSNSCFPWLFCNKEKKKAWYSNTQYSSGSRKQLCIWRPASIKSRC